MGLHRDGARDFAYYANDWIWPHGRTNLMKSTLLFFDGIALSLPQDIADRMIESSPHLAQPLLERGLLVNLDPDTHLQPSTASQLARDLRAVMERLEPGEWNFPPRVGSLGSFHWGGVLAQLEANELSATMVRRGIARPFSSEDDGDQRLFLIEPAARLLVLNSYSQALRADLQAQTDLALHPVAESVGDRRNWEMSMEALAQTAAGGRRPRAGFAATEIIQSDLEIVGVDVSGVPLDEVIGFRAEHREQFHAYIADLRELLTTTADLSRDQYVRELHAREKRLNEEAQALKKATRKAFGRTALATGVAIAGAIWTATQGDLIGALLAAGSAGAAVTRPAQSVTAYSYVIEAKQAY